MTTGMFRVALISLLCMSHALAEEWQLVSNRHGIEVSWRRLDQKGLREVRADGVVDFPAERLFTALGDLEHFPENMPPTESLEITHREGSLLWMHVVINPPWVSRRDYCVRATYERQSDGSLVNTWVQTNEYCPGSPKGTIRMAHTEGSWHLHPIDANHTHVVYQGATDPAGSLPMWIVNRAAARSMGDMFESLRKAAARERYARCNAPSLVCGLIALD
jgi:hypothetical protein